MNTLATCSSYHVCMYMHHLYVHVQRKQADVFALDTDEQDLTHRGRSIRDMERFDDINITDDEMEGGTQE